MIEIPIGSLLFLSSCPPAHIFAPLDPHVTVCGDTHGQFYDFLNIFQLNGLPSESNTYLFNGDFVDRGSFSVEILFTLFSLKLRYPNHVHVTRGNHETLNLNKAYGFEGEVKHKYDPLSLSLFSWFLKRAFCSRFSEFMFKSVTDIFNALPLCALLGGRIFVVHGGLFSRDNVTLDHIRAIDRFGQPPDQGLMADMLWSDPTATVRSTKTFHLIDFRFCFASLARSASEQARRCHGIWAGCDGKLSQDEQSRYGHFLYLFRLAHLFMQSTSFGRTKSRTRATR